MKQKVAVFGGEGSQTDLACRQFFVGDEVEKIYYKSMKSVCKALEEGECEVGILPVYNNIGGDVPESLESIEQAETLGIIDRKSINIRHFLVGITGASLSSIVEVQSHWQALKQCEQWLEQNIPSVKQVPTVSTKEGALAIVKEQDSSKACICPESTALSCGLEVLQSDIQPAKNKTTFVVVAKK